MAKEETWNQLRFITSNNNKVREASKILGFDLKQYSSIDFYEIQNDDISKIVEHKAHQAYQEFKCPILVEDSGLVFSAWNALPGGLIKWFETNVGCEGMLKMLEGFENREAFAICVVAIYDGQNFHVAKGEVRGEIANSIRGSSGFGWDTIFIPEGHKRTFAEMSFSDKNAISHRRQAFDHLKKYI